MIEVAFSYGKGPSQEVVSFIEQLLRVKFPEVFKKFVLLGDRFRPKKYRTKYKDPYSDVSEEVAIGSVISFNPEQEDNIVRFYFTLPEFFPQHLLPIIEVGNGDLICFDYSVDGFEDINPPVVLWLHENPEGKNVADLAINFQTFLSNLKSEEENENN